MKGGVRLAGGIWRGRRVQAVSGVRPTEGRVREALASIWMPRLAGARVLDLFAGSGAVGFEMVSRGAEQAVLVDRHPKVIEALRRSAQDLGQSSSRAIRIQRLELPRAISKLAPSFDLIFADPPYDFRDYGSLLTASSSVAVQGTAMVIEHSAERDLSTAWEVAGQAEGTEAWRLAEERRYGDCCLAFFERVAAD